MSAALHFRRAMFPALISGVLLIAAWSLLRISWPAVDLVQGSFLLAALVVTFTAIPAGAAITNLRTAGISFAMQILSLAIFLAMVAIDSRAFSFVALLKVSAVIIGWIALCIALPFLLRKCRLGIGVAIIAPSILAAIFLAFPASVVPAHRALASPGSSRADNFAAIAVYTCPVYGMFNATSGEMPSPWPSGRNRIMYQLTIFDQNTANPAANWLTQSFVFASLAAILGAVAHFTRRQSSAAK